MRRLKFEDGCYYHVYNRGVDKRKIFLDKGCYSRFIDSLKEFNSVETVFNYGEKLRMSSKSQGSSLGKEVKISKLVNVVCFCLMPNHYHLILKQLTQTGITRFMQKVGTGYSMFFNKKYERTGVLFEGRFKAKLIDSDEYMVHLSRYIHQNPLELFDSGWKEKGIKDESKAGDFLEKYKWSSFPAYIGTSSFFEIVNTRAILEYFGSNKDYKKFIYSDLGYDDKLFREAGFTLERKPVKS